MKKIFTIFILLGIFYSNLAFAHQPVREKDSTSNKQGQENSLETATEVKDPTLQSLAIYGRITQPLEIDFYKFTPSRSETIPIEVLVPVRVTNQNFIPSYVFVRPSSESQTGSENLPFVIPEGYEAIEVDTKSDREIFFEPFSVESLYHGEEKNFDLKAGETYYVAVYDDKGYTGDYSLGLGTVENFSDTSFLALLGEVFLIKLGVIGGNPIPWTDILGLFLFLAGFIIGLGAVTVIDFHGLLARKSEYWTEATIKTHKITKPLIWAGIGIATIGAAVYYRLSGLSSTATFHLIILVILVVNGLFLSFRISPYLLKQEAEGRAKQLLPQPLQKKNHVQLFRLFCWLVDCTIPFGLANINNKIDEYFENYYWIFSYIVRFFGTRFSLVRVSRKKSL